MVLFPVLSSNSCILFCTSVVKFAFIVYLNEIVYKEKRFHK